jgi:hypothetical protein
MDTTHPVNTYEGEQGGVKGTFTETKCVTLSGIPYWERKFTPKDNTNVPNKQS